jgi:hypothetical protein
MSFPLSGWVNAVNWSSSGKYAFIATHDACLTIVDTSAKTSSTIYLSHSPISSIIAISDTLICAIAFDRHIYQYHLDSNSTWTYKKCLTKEESSLVSSEIRTSVSSESVPSSIQDRLKQFQGGAAKKQSVSVTTSSQKNIHSANINSVNLINGKSLITSDFAGFVKVWNI